jgi:hypothetical protein
MLACPPESLLPESYGVVRSTISLGALSLEFLRVSNPNELSDSLDAEDFGQDERFPYWAELWPSSLALARFLVRRGVAGGTETLGRWSSDAEWGSSG